MAAIRSATIAGWTAALCIGAAVIAIVVASAKFPSPSVLVASIPLIGLRRDDSERKEDSRPHPQRPERLMEATLDALDTHIAIVNEAGEIIEVNES